MGCGSSKDVTQNGLDDAAGAPQPPPIPSEQKPRESEAPSVPPNKQAVQDDKDGVSLNEVSLQDVIDVQMTPTDNFTAIGDNNLSDADANLIRMARGRAVNYLGIKKELLTDVGLHLDDASSFQLNWKLQAEKNGVKVFTTFVEGNPWIVCKATVKIPADRDDIWALISNDYRIAEYDKLTAECTTVRTLSDRALVRRIASVAIWPVSPRDVVSLSVWDELSDGSLLMCSLSVDEPELCPSRSGFVRAVVLSGAFLVQPLSRRGQGPGGPETVLTFFGHTDLGGAVPASIVNLLATQTPIQMCTQMAALAKDTRSRLTLKGKALDADHEIQKQLNEVSRITKEYLIARRNANGAVERLDRGYSRVQQLMPSTISVNNVLDITTGSRDEKYSSLLPFGDKNDEPKPFCGYMSKEGRKVKNWKRRYFILDKGILSYFATEQSTTIIGEPLDLRGFSLSSTPENNQIVLTQSESKQDIVTAASLNKTVVLPEEMTTCRQLLLKVSTQQELHDWMQSFGEHIEYKSKLSIPQVCTGYMRKQGRFVKNWKERYFVLDRGILNYFDSSANYSSAYQADSGDGGGTVHNLRSVGESLKLMHSATVALVPPTGLVICTHGPQPRTLFLELDDVSETTRWKRAFEEHIQYLLTLQ